MIARGGSFYHNGSPGLCSANSTGKQPAKNLPQPQGIRVNRQRGRRVQRYRHLQLLPSGLQLPCRRAHQWHGVH